MRFFVEEKKHNIYTFYGDLDDIYITKNLQKQTVFSYINEMLLKEGFDRVVFYSGAGNLGKFTLDKKSAILSIAKNTKFAGAIDERNTEEKRKRKSKRVSSANRYDSINLSGDNSSCDETNENGFQERARENQNNNPEIEEIKYSEQEMLEGNFRTELVSWMKDKKHRTAVVFCNMWDFMTNTAPDVLRSYSELMMNGWERGDDKQNLYLFLYNGDIGNINDFTRLTERNGVTSLFVRNGENTLDYTRVMCVGLPQRDEIENLLNYLRVVGENGKRITFEYSVLDNLVKSLVYCTRRMLDKDGVTEDLRKIKNRIMKYVSSREEDVVEINEKVLAKIYKMSIETQKPLDLLCNKEGWEKPASRIKTFIEEAKSDAEERGGAETETKEKEPLAVLRFGGVEDCPEQGKIPHFAILGPPGVGKSEMARLIGKALNDEGILTIGHTVEVTKNDLVSQYIGGTPSKTMKKIQEAQGGVLFIDEAHLLFEDPKDGGVNYCREAISTIVGALTNPSLHFCLILAGYKSTPEYPCGVDKMIESDPGLSSRITNDNIITVDGYSIDLLTRIFKRCITDKGYEIDTDIENKIYSFIETKVSKQDRRTFGNARTVISWAEELMRMAKLNHRKIKTITLSDFKDEEQMWLTKDKKTTCEEIYNEIDAKYVGFDFLKEVIAEENRRIEDEKRRGIAVSKPSHKIFIGNPGVGKTTAAKLMAEFYGMSGVMGGRSVVELNSSKLTTYDYKKTLDSYISEATSKGSVLFIDEAHNLSENEYGRQAVRNLMNPMTENPNLTIVFAVYSSKLKEFVEIDPGLLSRVEKYNFPDYTGEQLYGIFEKEITNTGFKCTDEALRRINVLMNNWYNTRKAGFGNARDVKKLIKEMHKQRLIRCEMRNITEGEEYYLLTEADIPVAYKDIIEANSSSQTMDEILSKLGRYTGWASLKKLIMDKHKSVVVYRKDRLHGTKPEPGHYFFTGDPGTGKTTAASILAEAFFHLGLIGENKYLKVSAPDLIAGFVGQTAAKTKELLQSAAHGVLFIDEAYILGSGSELTGGDSYNQQAVAEIVKTLDDEEFRADTCVVFAGYEDDMHKFMKKNAGMSSRIKEVRFDPYSHEEAYQIFEKFVEDGNLKIGAGVREKCTCLLETVARTDKYANGRTARKIYEKTLERRADRIYNTESPTDMELSLIFEEDIPAIEDILF